MMLKDIIQNIPVLDTGQRNLALQQTTNKQPGKFATQFKGMRDFQNEDGEITDEEYNKLPDWMKNSLTHKKVKAITIL